MICNVYKVSKGTLYIFCIKMRKCKYFLSDLEQNQKCDKIKTVKQKLKHRNNVRNTEKERK